MRSSIHRLINFLFCWLIFIMPFSVYAQQISIHHPQLQFLFEDSLLKNNSFHSALLPVKVSKGQFLNQFHQNADARNIFVAPVLDAMGGYEHNSKKFTYRFGQGAYLAGNLGSKGGFELSAVMYEQRFPGQSFSIDSLQLVPRNNRYLWGKHEDAGYLNIRGNIYWKALKWLTFTAGNDKHFIGDGQQSLLLSENAAAYPFFQTRLNIWKVNYIHQVMFMRDLVPQAGNSRYPKYSSQHVLSYNITPKFNIYVFEAVIWRKQDSVRHRNFDVSYLNPVIFYRPLEYNQGSPDNVLMGLGGKIKVIGKNYLYAQLLLDEFNLKEVKNNKGWWGIKYGYQLGYKTYELFKSRSSMFSLEYNYTRPFTYSHSYSLQNYGYLKEPLAHPLGSNFKELTGILHVALSKKWFLHAKGSYMRYGADPPGLNYGSDIYKRQWTYTKYYGNFTTQGIMHTIVFGEITVSKMIFPLWRLTAFSSVSATMLKTGVEKELSPYFQFGLNTLLYE